MKLGEGPQTPQDEDADRNELCPETLRKASQNSLVWVFNMCSVLLNILHGILDIEQPLIMWCSSPLQAFTFHAIL